MSDFPTPTLILYRTAAIGDECILGVLRDNSRVVAHTLELPWRDNAANRSCVAPGLYRVHPKISQHLGPVFAFEDAQTAPRTALRIHSGNTAADIEGCVLVGRRYGVLNGHVAVLDSRRTMHTLVQDYREGFTLDINIEDLA